jgi:hypothetical protein
MFSIGGGPGFFYKGSTCTFIRRTHAFFSIERASIVPLVLNQVVLNRFKPMRAVRSVQSSNMDVLRALRPNCWLVQLIAADWSIMLT